MAGSAGSLTSEIAMIANGLSRTHDDACLGETLTALRRVMQMLDAIEDKAAVNCTCPHRHNVDSEVTA